MIVRHKALRVDNQKEIEGFVIKENSQYFIISEDNTKYLVEEASIQPCFTDCKNSLIWVNDIIFSEKLTSEESSKFLWLLKKAQGTI